MPPLQLVLNVALQGVALPLMVVAAVGYVSARFLGQPGRIAGGLVAMALGFVAGNYFLDAIELRIDSEHAFSIPDFVRAIGMTITGVIPAGQSVPSSRVWLFWSAVLAGLVGLLLRVPRLPIAAAWMIRVVTVIFLSRLLVGPGMREETVWLWPVFALVLLVDWYLLEVVANESTSTWLTQALIWVSLAAATVLIHAHTGRFTDAATILAGCWAGLAIAERLQPSSQLRSSAMPVMAVMLPGIMLQAQQTTFSDVPALAFMLIGLTPMALIRLLFVPNWKKSTTPYVVTAWALLLIPTLLAMILAVSNETLAFE